MSEEEGSISLITLPDKSRFPKLLTNFIGNVISVAIVIGVEMGIRPAFSAMCDIKPTGGLCVDGTVR